MAPHAKVEETMTASTDPKCRVLPGLSRQPLKYCGTLDKYHSIELTPIIGTEFPELKIVEILNDDEKIRDLAVLVSQRGVVFLRNQKIDIDQHKLLASKLGELTGKPKSSKLHKHFLFNNALKIPVDDSGRLDEEVSIISSKALRKLTPEGFTYNGFAGDVWHSDLIYEKIPSDYSLLHMQEIPSDGSGGDTLWASGYEMYDRISLPIRRLLENLKVVHDESNGRSKMPKDFDLSALGERGAPENVGDSLTATHPMVRTNPVTGWKSIYGTGSLVHQRHIEGVTRHESQMLDTYLRQLITQNHDLQVRFSWNKHDMAIWDNRSVFHCVTNDYEGSRRGNRVVSLGERPYYDPSSKSRREALAADG